MCVGGRGGEERGGGGSRKLRAARELNAEPSGGFGYRWDCLSVSIVLTRPPFALCSHWPPASSFRGAGGSDTIDIWGVLEC